MYEFCPHPNTMNGATGFFLSFDPFTGSTALSIRSTVGFTESVSSSTKSSSVIEPGLTPLYSGGAGFLDVDDFQFAARSTVNSFGLKSKSMVWIWVPGALPLESGVWKWRWGWDAVGLSG